MKFSEDISALPATVEGYVLRRGRVAQVPPEMPDELLHIADERRQFRLC